MELSFWKSRWEKGKTGFHSPIVNPKLKEYWPDFPLPKNSTVLVPLCGKSLDMRWLAEKGLQVIGIEISDIACHQFFEEQKLSFQIKSKGDFTVYESDNIKIWQGDFFKMKPQYLPEIHGIYDRAALVALPPKKREKYSKKIFTLTDSLCHIFLHSFEYPEMEMNGPPFSVSEEEIKQLYGNKFNITCLETIDILSNNEKFKRWGLSKLKGKIYHLSNN